LALADQRVRDIPPELTQIKALLAETWRNGGKYNGPQFQISDLARIYKSRLTHTLVGTATAKQWLDEAKYLHAKAKSGKRFSSTEAPVALSDSDRLRVSVIDYRFSEALFSAREAAATLTPEQRLAQVAQARLTALKIEGQFFWRI
jgi:hypothetical protein